MRQFISQLSSAFKGDSFTKKNLRVLVEKTDTNSNDHALFSNPKTLAHACATPLTVIKCCVQQSLEKSNLSEQQMLLNSSLVAIDRMKNILNSVLDNQTPRSGPVDLNVLLTEAIKLVQNSNQSQISYITARTIDAQILGSSTLVSEMLICILKNAIEASRNEKIIVHLSARKAWVRIDITDFGHGMSERQLKLASKTSFSTKSTGNGIGLPFVRETIHQYGGTLSIMSRVGVGTWISIRLPKA